MKEAIFARAREIWQGLRLLALGFRRIVVGACAAIAMVVIYSFATIGSYGLNVAGISGLALTTTSTTAEAKKRRRRGRARGKSRRRRGGRRRRRQRRRRRRNNKWYWYWGWYYW